jgi:N-6 DNA Methylase
MENQIMKELSMILHRGYSAYNVFDDWLDLMLYALQRDDLHYLEIVRRYRNNQPKGEREIDYFSNAFGLLLKQMKETNEETLSEIYRQWKLGDKYSGQIFTPKHIASAIAQMLQPSGHILDPACGAGILLVESIKIMTNEQLDNALFFGQDIDPTCVKMCALNLLFFNVNGYVIQGNTLAMECDKVYQTRRSYMGGSVRELKERELQIFKDKFIGMVKNEPRLHETKPITISAKKIEQLKLV